MVSDVALKRKFLASVKNWVRVQEGECSRGKNGSCVAFEVRRQLAERDSFPELELKHQERWCLGAACAQNPPGPSQLCCWGRLPAGAGLNEGAAQSLAATGAIIVGCGSPCPLASVL